MIWQRDWAEELAEARAPAGRQPLARARSGSDSLGRLFSEFTYLSQRGRTLDRIGKATLSVPMDAWCEAVAESSCRASREVRDPRVWSCRS